MSKRDDAINKVYENIVAGDAEQAFHAARAIAELDKVQRSRKAYGF